MMETTSIITHSQFKIETALKERKAFDDQSAVNLEEAKVNLSPFWMLWRKAA